MKRFLFFLRSGTAFHFILLAGLLILSVIFSGSSAPLRIDLQNLVFDRLNILFPRENSREVLIIDIDEKSLEKYGQWPWSRNNMAELTDRLTGFGAKVIAFDGVFAEADRTSPHNIYNNLPASMKSSYESLKELNYDEIFAESIRKSGIFVTAFTYGRSDRADHTPEDKKKILTRSNIEKVFLSQASRFDAAALNLEIFTKVSAGNGSFMARPDRDGVLRRAGMIFTNGKTLYPSLSVEALRVGLLGRKGMIRIAETPSEERGEIDTDYRIVIGDKIIPVEGDGILNVHYRYFCNEDDLRRDIIPCTAQDYISAAKIMDKTLEHQISNLVKDKIILIGSSAEGLKDLRSTALQPFRPGVEVHANVIEQILQGQYLLRPIVTKAAEAMFILVIGLFFILVAPFISAGIAFLLCLFIICIAVFLAVWMYVDYRILVDPVYPSLSVLMIFIVSTILSYSRAEARRKQTRTAFGMYVARDVLRELEKNPDKLKLGGERRELTVMFTDIRKFTSISEGLSPEELINLMNEFLTAMTDIVMNYGGTVDKYIGDAMMAFWNAPRDIPDHRRQACLAALQMQTALIPINERVKSKALELGKEPVLLNAGIGINTGDCAVGNMGSKQRFAYSALGDAVNLSSRLEGLTKLYGFNIVIGENTYRQVRDFAVIELDIVKVVGKEIPVRIYALMGDPSKSQEEEFSIWVQEHEVFLNYYRSAQFEKASQHMKICRKYAGSEGEVLYDLYKARIRGLKRDGVSEGWDGVYEAKSK